MFALARSTRKARNGRQFYSLFLLPIINLIINITLWPQNILSAHGQHDTQVAKNATNPLIYKRLRFDQNFLQVYRRFQKTLTIDETRVTFEVNQTRSDETKGPVKYTYYENNQVEATSLTQDDIIFEALDQAYLTRLYPAYLFTYDNKRDMAESSDPRLVSREKCHRELNFLMRQLSAVQSARTNGAAAGVQLNNTFSMDVLALFDAFATEESGLIQGNYVWSGYWRQCKRSLIFNRDAANPENTLKFKSRYCIASIRSKRWDKLAASRIVELERERHFKYPEQKYDYARFHRIQLGLCLPESCDSNLINERHEDVRRLATHRLSEPLRSYQLTDLFCLPDETSKLRQVDTSGRLFLVFIAVWLAIVICATVYDNRVGLNEKLLGPVKPTGWLEKMVDSMSLFRNYERLTGSKSSQMKPAAQQVNVQAAGEAKSTSERCEPSVMDLQFVNCVKVVATLSILFGHGGMMFKHLDRFPTNYTSSHMLMIHFMFSAVFFVDWYFVITGFITAYALFVTKRVEQNTWADWLHTIVHRYLRLAPLYCLLFWFAKSIFKHTSSGPLWDYGTNNMTLRAVCQRESFIYPLTLTSNFHPIHDECTVPSWYLSCDFQFYLMTPFLLILLSKAPSLGWLASLGVIGANIALRFYRYLTDSRAKHLDLMRPRHDTFMRLNWDMHATYVYPHYRIASYLIGILAGHYAYMVLSGQWRSALFYNSAHLRALGVKTKISSKEEASNKRRSDLLRFLVWIVSVTILIMMMFVTAIIYQFPPALEPHIKYIASFTYSISHTSVSLGISLFLVTIMFGQFGSLKRIMSWPAWTLVTRVGYFVFLAQVELIFWFNQTGDRPNDLIAPELIKSIVYICATLYMLSTILTLLFELPIAQLERNFVAPLFKFSSGAHQPAAVPASLSPRPTRRKSTVASGCAPPKQDARSMTRRRISMQSAGDK